MIQCLAFRSCQVRGSTTVGLARLHEPIRPKHWQFFQGLRVSGCSIFRKWLPILPVAQAGFASWHAWECLESDRFFQETKNEMMVRLPHRWLRFVCRPAWSCPCNRCRSCAQLDVCYLVRRTGTTDPQASLKHVGCLSANAAQGFKAHVSVFSQAKTCFCLSTAMRRAKTSCIGLVGSG